MTNKTATLIDNVMISNKLFYNYTPYILLDDISDHYPCLVILHNIYKCKKDKIRITKRTLNDSTINQLNDTLSNTDWNYLEKLDANEGFNKFHETLTLALDRTYPKREYLIRHDKIVRDPWVMKGLSNSLRRQKQMYRNQLGSNNTELIDKYKKYRNTLQKILCSSKLQYFTRKCEE